MRVEQSLRITAPVHQRSGIARLSNLSSIINQTFASSDSLKIFVNMGAHTAASTGLMATVKNETSYKSPPSSLSDSSQHEGEVRGRRQDRESTSTAKAEDENDDNGDGGDALPGKPRKRKRSRKGLEKNFPCTHHDCGKSYSRAEHLYRHQLNREYTVASCWATQSNDYRYAEENL